MRIGVLTNTGTTSKRISEKFKFQFCATKEEDILHKSTNTVLLQHVMIQWILRFKA